MGFGRNRRGAAAVLAGTGLSQGCRRKGVRRQGRVVAVSSVGGTRFGRLIQYGEQHASALVGDLPYDTAAARKLEAERQRVMGYAKVMLAGGTGEACVDPEDVVLAMKSAAHSLRQSGIGNGSWVSAAQGLAGARALEVFSKVIDGELSCEPGMTPADIWTAIGVAKALTTKA